LRAREGYFPPHTLKCSDEWAVVKIPKLNAIVVYYENLTPSIYILMNIYKLLITFAAMNFICEVCVQQRAIIFVVDAGIELMGWTILLLTLYDKSS